MSRLHRQKLRLRSFQRGEGIIAPDDDQVDAEAAAELGTSHQVLEQLDAGADDETLELPSLPHQEIP